MVPTPKSPSVINVPTLLTKISALELAVAIKVAPAMSSFKCKTATKFYGWIATYNGFLEATYHRTTFLYTAQNSHRKLLLKI